MTLAIADAVCRCPTGLWPFFVHYFLPGLCIVLAIGAVVSLGMLCRAMLEPPTRGY